MLNKRLVVVSNRLPIVVEQRDNLMKVRPSAGGLVTALSPVMEREAGLWIGWLGENSSTVSQEAFEEFRREHPYELRNVPLSEEEVKQYYDGFSNVAIWPLFHDLLGHCRFDLSQWRAYDDVNRRFAEVVAQSLEPDDFVWVHDYQLLLVAYHLRLMGVTQPLGFFLHIPFPSEDMLRRLPWHKEIMRSLMEYDLLGFQSRRDRKNFVDCVRSVVGRANIDERRGFSSMIREHDRYTVIQYRDRIVKAGHFPISIDFEEFAGPAASEPVADEARYFHEGFSARTLVLGIDRLDYTKGIPHRFLAFERALEKYQDLRGNISLFQLVIPSRVNVPGYQELKTELDTLVGRINGRFYRKGWIPIYYKYGRLNRTQLLGRYRACDIALVTPLRDGMNLVAKEYCASQIDLDGVLILSDFAGTAEQLREGPIIVNPFDREGMADAIYQAYHMDREERRRRMATLREQIKNQDVHRWVAEFFEAYADPVLSIVPNEAEATVS